MIFLKWIRESNFTLLSSLQFPFLFLINICPLPVVFLARSFSNHLDFKIYGVTSLKTLVVETRYEHESAHKPKFRLNLGQFEASKPRFREGTILQTFTEHLPNSIWLFRTSHLNLTAEWCKVRCLVFRLKWLAAI